MEIFSVITVDTKSASQSTFSTGICKLVDYVASQTPYRANDKNHIIRDI
jgi:hypothetical protein